MAIIIPTPCDQPETFYEEQLLAHHSSGENAANHVHECLSRLITILRMNERDRLNHIKGTYY